MFLTPVKPKKQNCTKAVARLFHTYYLAERLAIEAPPDRAAHGCGDAGASGVCETRGSRMYSSQLTDTADR